MKKESMLMTGAAALVALVAVSGIAFATFAQNSATNITNANKSGMHAMMRGWQNLTDEEKASLDKERDTRRQEMEAKRSEIHDAIASGYEAWAAAVKKNLGEDAPILAKVNSGNFAKYAEGENYMEKGRAIFEELGIDQGKGMMGGFGKGGGRGCMMNDAGTATDTQ